MAAPGGEGERGRAPLVGARAPMHVEVALPCELTSASRARRVARDALGAWGCDELVDTVELLVSELVVNAVIHASSAPALHLSLDGGVVRVEVADQDPQLPRMQDHQPNAASGRGLRILEAMADDWGVEPAPDGKTVWFEIHVGR